ncbi:hypothetical protein D3C72_1281360 [compost metagenome]
MLSGLHKTAAHTLDVAAQLAVFDAQGHGALHDGWTREGGQQLGIEHPVHHIGRSRHIANAPVGRKNLGKAADIDGALQAVEHRQARGMLGGDMAVGIVLHHIKAELLGQLQHMVRRCRVQAVAGGVVQYTHAHIEFGRMGFAIPAHGGQIGAIRAARYGQYLHT